MVDENETRITSHTGGQKGLKEARFDLIPAEAIWWLAVLYGRGAAKYTTYGECTCNVTAESQSKPEVNAGAATTSGSSKRILNMLRGNYRTRKRGLEGRATKSGLQGRKRSGTVSIHDESTRTTELPLTSMRFSFLNPVEFVERLQSTWTTTTSAANGGVPSVSEADYATDATLDSGTTKDGSQNTEMLHKPGCPALEVVSQGDHNWRLGYLWSLSFAAAMRHMWKFWRGEDMDLETGVPHPICAAFHMFGLTTFMETHPEFDDRPGKQ